MCLGDATDRAIIDLCGIGGQKRADLSYYLCFEHGKTGGPNDPRASVGCAGREVRVYTRRADARRSPHEHPTSCWRPARPSTAAPSWIVELVETGVRRAGGGRGTKRSGTAR